MPLRGYESRCPACGKRVSIPEWLLVLVLVVIAGLLGGGILAAGHVRYGTGRGIGRSEPVYTAARGFVMKQPGMQNATFAPAGETEIEQWGPVTYRVAGRAWTRDARGKAAQLLYTCLIERERSTWMLREISLQVSEK
jgi:hypothetical protein